MPTIDLGQVKGDKGDPFKYEDFTAAQLAALKGAKGDTPTIKAGSATSLDATAAPTVSATTSGTTTTFNFGIPKGDTSDIKTPTFTDTVSTYTTLSAANTAAETASNAIKSKVSIFTTLSNIKKSFSAIVQGLKILGTNVGAITGITSDLAGESETVAASIKAVNQLNSNLGIKKQLITTKTISLTTGNLPSEGFYSGTVDLGNFPVPFISTPKVMGCMTSANGYTILVGITGSTTTSWGKATIMSNAQRTNFPSSINLIAIQTI